MAVPYIPHGFDTLPEQATRRHTLHGLSFNLMVLGPTGIGKTTLINSLFDFDYGDNPDEELQLSNVTLRSKEYKPANKTINLKLSIIESKGFDNQLDKTNSHKPIVNYIDAKYAEHLKNEQEAQESLYNEKADSRIHCCIYMISPTGHGLRAIDLVTMKQLHQRVCLVPVIGKADTLTEKERHHFKEEVRRQLAVNGIKIYSSNDYQLPLAIASSNDIITENGKKQRARVYPWGKLYIEKDLEFSKLRDLVLQTNMLSLKLDQQSEQKRLVACEG